MEGGGRWKAGGDGRRGRAKVGPAAAMRNKVVLAAGLGVGEFRRTRRHRVHTQLFPLDFVWIMKPDKHFIAAAGVVVATICLIALTWIGTARAIYAQRLENVSRITATLSNQALTLSEQINRQILGLDQTLRILVTAWKADPVHFDLEAWRTQAVVLNGLSRDMVLTDADGIIRQSSVNEAINQNASGLDYFRAFAGPPRSSDQPGDELYIGPATIDGVMRQWHMDVARALHNPDGSFAGVIDADYRIASITDVFSQTDLGAGSFVTLVGLDDGKLRGAVGPAAIDPDASVADTAMFAAIQASDTGVWTGPTANDAIRRIHAFRRLPGRNLAVIVAMTEDEALRPATIWRQQADLFAACITALLAVLALALVQGTRLARRRAALVAEDRAILAASNAQLEVARAFSAAKAEQLEATLTGMSDGVSMIDAHMCLVEWNERFPEIAGVPPEMLRVGLPMEEILRAQIRTGQFGRIPDPEAEVARRMARIRVAPFGVTQRQRPDGHTIELRRNRLPDGGFVTLYADITEHKLAEEALRAAKATAELASVEKSRFVAIVSHEIRTPLNALLNTVRLLSDSVLVPAQQSLLTMARQSGEALFGLINDILALCQIEAGKLSIRPSLFELRPLLQSSAEMFTAQAEHRGITICVMIAEGTPETLLTDPNRLRQVLLNLLSNAVKYARPGEVWLTAEPGQEPDEAVRLTVKDNGPVITAEAHERLFHPFSRLERSEGEDPPGTGLGLSICHHLVTLMGGKIGCEAWLPNGATDAREGNAFWITLPAATLAHRGMPREADDGAATTGQALLALADPASHGGEVPRRWPPRTRILLVEDIVANQLVTSTLLRRAGHHVDIAASGPDAVAAIQRTPYDLVFMDIFMPGMSGQEATQIIRGLPEPARSTQIVALTANVDPGEEAKFKAAGMSGLLGKPVSIAELLDTLDKHVWQAHVAAADPTAMAAIADPLETSRATPAGREANSRAEAYSPIEAYSTSGAVASEATSGRTAPSSGRRVPILAAERINELRANLPPETFTHLIEECLVDMDHRLPALRRALVAGVPGAVTAHAHALVGMAAGYGMAAMEARLRTIMTAARAGDLAPLGPDVVPALELDFAEAAATLREMLRSEVV
jgi:signal transduction histidine kinase/CheY-like chemotaxis protein